LARQACIGTLEVYALPFQQASGSDNDYIGYIPLQRTGGEPERGGGKIDSGRMTLPGHVR